MNNNVFYSSIFNRKVLEFIPFFIPMPESGKRDANFRNIPSGSVSVLDECERFDRLRCDGSLHLLK